MLGPSVKVLAVLAPALSYASLIKRDLTPVSAPAPGWSYQGCYTDSTSARKLDSASYQSSSMTVESCVSFCSNQGYTTAGVEYSTECYCGFEVKSGSTKGSDSNCQNACGGAASEPCGGASYLSVYSNGKPGGTAKTPLNGYSYLGCYTDSVSNRALVSSRPQQPSGQRQCRVRLGLCSSCMAYRLLPRHACGLRKPLIVDLESCRSQRLDFSSHD